MEKAIPLLLEGGCLEDETLALRRQLEDAQRENARLLRTVQNLRTILNPLYHGLRAIFGEIELGIGEEMASAGRRESGDVDPRWESYKSQFPGVPSKIIDALLIHGSMQITHLARLLKIANSTLYHAGDKLNSAGAITRSGGIWSLRK